MGAIHAKTHNLVTVTNDSYINAQSVCELLLKIAEIGYENEVTVVLDNAKYQHAHIVYEQAELLGIELLHLPTYSPNLNLIERLWKFIKKKCLYSIYYDTFGAFKRSISACLAGIECGEYESELKTLLTLKFQSFKNVQTV